MAEITDPQVVAYSDNYMRKLAEDMRDLQARLTAAKIEYQTIIQPILAGYVDTDVLNDGREVSEGAYQPTKLEMTDLSAHINAILAELDTVGQAELRAKFTIRPMNIA